MTTAIPTQTIHRPGPTAGSHNRPGAPGGALGGSSVDPVKLLKQYYPMLVLAALVGTGLGVVAHFALLYLAPSYTSSVVYECYDPTTDVTTAARTQGSNNDFERFINTQARVMISPLILDAAIKTPEVQKTKWASRFMELGAFQPDRAARRLADDVSARVLPQTSLVELKMTASDPKDAMTIVSAVHEAYQSELKDKRISDSADRRQFLGAQVTKMLGEIQTLKTQRADVLTQFGMESGSEGGSTEWTQIQQNESKSADTDANLAEIRSQLQEYKAKLENNKVGEVPDKVREQAQRDPLIQSQDSKIASLRDSEAAILRQGYLENHPDVLAVRAQLDAAERQRAEQIDERANKLWSAEIDGMRTSMLALEATAKDLSEKREVFRTKRKDLMQGKVKFEQLDSELKAKSEGLQLYQKSLDNVEIMSGGSTAGRTLSDRVRVIASPQIPKGVSFPKMKVIVPLAIILCTGLVGGLIFLRELLDQRVRGPSDAAMVPRIRVLGVVPQASEDPSRPACVETAFRDSPAGVLTESFRHIRAPLIQKMDQAGHKSCLILGGMPGSGATSVACNLALGCAAASERVLLIDANFRRPGVHKVFKVPEGPGLGDVLAGQAEFGQVVRVGVCGSLDIVAAGTPAGRTLPERLSGEAMSRVLREAATRYDRIFIDSAPAIVAGDGLMLANRCDAVVVVVRAYAEKKGLLARIRAQLSDTRADFMGVVVNAVRSSAGGYFKRNIKATHQYQNNGKA